MSKIYPGMSVRKQHIFINDKECKECATCKQIKELSAYGNNKATPTGIHYMCKQCISIRAANVYKNSESYREKNKARIKKARLLKKELKNG